MDRRSLLAALAVLALSLSLLSGSASGHATHHGKTKPHGASGAGASPETCVVHALPSSFMDQGEFDMASSVADVVEVECEEVYAEHFVTISANELYSRCDKSLEWSKIVDGTGEGTDGPSVTLQLDNDGNAMAVVLAGPSCAAGESLISAHLDEAPFTTATTAFTVLPPRPTEPGVFATPSHVVESETESAAMTIVQVEFPPVFAEEPVNINAPQLYARCHVLPKVLWLRLPRREGIEVTVGEQISGVRLDNDGNAFAVVLAFGSCAAGTSMIEASLENAPYTTYTTEFTVEAPRPTFPE